MKFDTSIFLESVEKIQVSLKSWEILPSCRETHNKHFIKFNKFILENRAVHEVKWNEVKWSEVKWSEVRWSEVRWSEVQCREGGKNETLWEKFIWVVKWWEVKGWGESVSTICEGKNTGNCIQYFLNVVLFTFCTCCILRCLVCIVVVVLCVLL